MSVVRFGIQITVKYLIPMRDILSICYYNTWEGLMLCHYQRTVSSKHNAKFNLFKASSSALPSDEIHISSAVEEPLRSPLDCALRD